MEKERFFISQFNSKKIGDDAALVDGWVVSTDAFCENVHFKRDWMELEQIGAKAMLVNISDAIAMNATPKYALVSVALPKDLSPRQMECLARGIKQSAKVWGVEIVGGDTVAAEKIDISVTILAKGKHVRFRTPVREGYLIGYTGDLGRVAKDLGRLMRGGKVARRSKFVTPSIRAAFMRRCGRILKAAMDISDGLFDDMAKLSRTNTIGFELFRKVCKAQGCSGEEYEILFAIDPRDLRSLRRRAAASRTPITIVAKAVRGRFRNRCKPHHF